MTPCWTRAGTLPRRGTRAGECLGELLGEFADPFESACVCGWTREAGGGLLRAAAAAAALT